MISSGNAGRVMHMTSAAQAEMRKGVAAGNMQTVAAIHKQLGFGGSSTRLPIRFLLTTSGANLTSRFCCQCFHVHRLLDVCHT